MGTAEFAVPSLREAAAHHEVLAVVTQPDRSGSRGAPAGRPVRDAARALGLEVRTPARIRDAAAVRDVLGLGPEVILVAAYGQILPAPLLDGPHHGAVNVHASLLPRWRGAAPVAQAILAGDAETGVSIMRMDPGLDTGPVYASARMPIRADATTPLLTAALAGLGAELLIDVLSDLARGEARAEPQPAEGVTYAPRLTRAAGALDWSTHTAEEVDRHVRALLPWPGVTLPVAGTPVRVLAGAPCESPAPDDAPGTIVERVGEAIVVAAREGAYRLDRVVPPGARAMTPAAFLRGRRDR